MSLLMVAVGVLMAATSIETWYSFVLPTSTIAPNDFVSVDDVSVAKDLSAQWLVKNAGIPGVFMGLPNAVALGLLMCGLGGLTAVVQTGEADDYSGRDKFLMLGAILGVVSLLIGHFAWTSLQEMQLTMQDPANGGAFNHPQSGILHFQVLFVVGIILQVGLIFQNLTTMHQERKLEKALAAAQGREMQSSIIDSLRVASSSMLSKMAGAAGGKSEK